MIGTLLNGAYQQDVKLNEAISDVEDFIEWSNEDLFQERITEEEHAIAVNNYNQLILTLKSIKNEKYCIK